MSCTFCATGAGKSICCNITESETDRSIWSLFHTIKKTNLSLLKKELRWIINLKKLWIGLFSLIGK